MGEKEILFLKVEVAKLAKEKEEERATRINAWNKLNNMVQEKKKMEVKYKAEITQLHEDINELKIHLVSITKYVIHSFVPTLHSQIITQPCMCYL